MGSVGVRAFGARYSLVWCCYRVICLLCAAKLHRSMATSVKFLQFLSSSLECIYDIILVACSLCVSQRRTACSPPHPVMGLCTAVGVSVPLVWWAPISTSSWRVKRRRPWGENSSTSSWARVTNITRRGASPSNWACSCSKLSLWLCRWIQHSAMMSLPFNPHQYHIMNEHVHK